MKLYLVRNGETVENKQWIVQWRLDGSLTDKGIKQAWKLAERLSDETFDHIYTSDLWRAQQTAYILREHHENTPVTRDQKLRDKSHEAYREDEQQFRERVLSVFAHLHEQHYDENILIITHTRPMRIMTEYIENNFSLDGMYSDTDFSNTWVTAYEFSGSKATKLHNDCTAHLR